MSGLLPTDENKVARGSTVEVELETVAADDVVSGSPRQGVVQIGALGDTEVGIWELRSGVVTDTEVDELFVVLSGGATIDLLDEGRTVEVGAGDVMRLVAGSRTRWTVTDHIRKVYIS